MARGKGTVWYEKKLRALAEEIQGKEARFRVLSKSYEEAQLQLKGKDELVRTQQNTIDTEMEERLKAEARAREYAQDAETTREYLKDAKDRVKELEFEVKALQRILTVVGHVGIFDLK